MFSVGFLGFVGDVWDHGWMIMGALYGFSLSYGYVFDVVQIMFRGISLGRICLDSCFCKDVFYTIES